MSKRKILPAVLLSAVTTAVCSQSLDQSEVRLPYGELRQILARSETKTQPAAPGPSLVSAQLRLSLDREKLVLDGSFRTVSFHDNISFVPLLSGNVALSSQDPQDAILLIQQESLCLAVNQAGSKTIQTRLLPTQSTFRIKLPPCPSILLEVGELPADRSVAVGIGDREEILNAGDVRPLSPSGESLSFRLLDLEATREAQRPPVPSTWTWQHQALVKPQESELLYQLISRASAPDGSGTTAILPLPAEARDIQVTGEDLLSHEKIRSSNAQPALSLTWKTRGVLDRRIHLTYRMPLRPLDRTWKLQAPGGDGTHSRFLIANSPLLGFSADGLSAPLTPQGLPGEFVEALRGGNHQAIEATTSAELAVTSVPVAATADGVIPLAKWSLNLEPDGAMLLKGDLTIDHKSALDFLFDTPDGMKLLSCEANGESVQPVDLGEGRLKLTLPSNGGKSAIQCSFTGRGPAIDPVEGTISLALPRSPLFIHSLSWRLILPAGYQAETHGNLTRIPENTTQGVSLIKNLCRDERPEVRVFYQRTDLNR